MWSSRRRELLKTQTLLFFTQKKNPVFEVEIQLRKTKLSSNPEIELYQKENPEKKKRKKDEKFGAAQVKKDWRNSQSLALTFLWIVKKEKKKKTQK